MKVRSFLIEGEETVVVRTFLRRGKNWWHVGAGAVLREQDDLTVHGVRLVRLQAQPTATGPIPVGEPAAAPEPEKASGDRHDC